MCLPVSRWPLTLKMTTTLVNRDVNMEKESAMEKSYKYVNINKIIIIKYSIYIAPYSQSALWRCTLFLELL